MIEGGGGGEGDFGSGGGKNGEGLNRGVEKVVEVGGL